MDVTTAEARARKAFERRFGKSMLPLRIVSVTRTSFKVIDDESGSWAHYDHSGHRLFRREDHDAQDN